jgi:hypothetical protein
MTEKRNTVVTKRVPPLSFWVYSLYLVVNPETLRFRPCFHCSKAAEGFHSGIRTKSAHKACKANEVTYSAAVRHGKSMLRD